MLYRNGIYTAFNGCGTTDPTQSDIRFYNILKSWKENGNIDFTFSDSHDKTYSVKDTSLDSTLKSRLAQRLSNSKCLILIITHNTKNSSNIVKFEIEQAINTYNLPIILAFVDENLIKEKTSYHDNLLPDYLKEKIQNDEVKCLYIPFKLKAIKNAIENFNVHKNYENNSYTYRNHNSWD